MWFILGGINPPFPYRCTMGKKRNWAKIKAEYCTTDISTRKIAKKYNIPYTTLCQRAMRERWSESKEESVKSIKAEVEARVLQKAINKEIERKVKANELHNELYDKGLDVAKMLLDKYMQDLREGKKRTGATATNLDYLMGAVSKAQKGQRLSLSIDNTDTTTDKEPEIKIISGLDINQV